MSQPFLIVVVRSTSDRPCRLEGYLDLVEARRSIPGQPGDMPVAFRVHHSVYERQDAGPKPIGVSASHPAFFYVGTVLAFRGGLHAIVLNELAFGLPGPRTVVHLPVRLAANNRPGKPYPIGITALERCPRPTASATPELLARACAG